MANNQGVSKPDSGTKKSSGWETAGKIFGGVAAILLAIAGAKGKNNWYGKRQQNYFRSQWWWVWRLPNRDDETSQQITQNTIENALNMMFPDGNPDDE